MKNCIKENFTIISNKIVNDCNLSAGAKGVACYLLSKPDGWQFYMLDIKNNFKESLGKIKKYIKELEDIGFLTRTKTTKVINGRNKFIWIYDFNIDYIYIDANCIDANCIDANCMNTKVGVYNNTNNINNTKINNTKINNTNNKKKNKEKYNLDFIEDINFKKVFSKWTEYKIEKKEDYKTQTSVKVAFNNLLKLSNNNYILADKIVEQSIMNDWKGLFEYKEKKQENNSSSNKGFKFY